MICPECRGGKHDVCIDAMKGKDYSHCDCQHRTKQKNIILPEKETADEQPVTAAGPAEPSVLFAD